MDTFKTKQHTLSPGCLPTTMIYYSLHSPIHHSQKLYHRQSHKIKERNDYEGELVRHARLHVVKYGFRLWKHWIRIRHIIHMWNVHLYLGRSVLMSQSCATTSQEKHPGSSTSSSGQDLGFRWQNRRKSNAYSVHVGWWNYMLNEMRIIHVTHHTRHEGTYILCDEYRSHHVLGTYLLEELQGLPVHALDRNHKLEC